MEPGWECPGRPAVVLVLTIFTTFLFRPAVLAGLTMPSLTQPEFPRWKSWTQALALIRFFGKTQRALDAWLRTHEKTLYVRVFAGKESVATRNRYVDLGNEDDLAAWQADATSGKAAACWITGPGGCGKSTLAFRMARDLHDATRRHPILPVVVEEDWDGSLVDHLGERLRIAARRPSTWMVTKLAHTGRLVPIVDGLSERRLADASEQVAALWRQGIFRHLLLTSRATEPPDADFRKVEVGALDALRLPAFVGAYVAEGEVDPVVKALGTFGRGEPIRPLFARLAIEQLREDRELPPTFVGLVDRYLRRLRPPGFREAGFLRAARKAAEASVEDALAPRAVGEDYLCGFLANEEVAFSDDDGAPLTPQRVVDHLVRCGLLERVRELGANRVRFVADPIAELLYAKSFVDRGGSKLQALRRRLARSGEDVRGLLEALEQVEAS